MLSHDSGLRLRCQWQSDHLTYPDGRVVTTTYDLADRLSTVTDWDGRITSYSYDAANRQTGINYPNGVTAAYDYDPADRLLSILHTSPVSGTIAAFTYTLDAVGNRLTMDDLQGTTSYIYDELYRLTGRSPIPMAMLWNTFTIQWATG